MAEEIRIDKQVFHDRLSHFVSAWKADKRSGDALFGGAGSIVVMMGRTEESSAFQKNNSMHVSCRRLSVVASAMRLIQVNDTSVLAAGLRVSCNLISFYHREALHCYDSEERFCRTPS
jgi:nucleosome binding factor SPN SPT16 subunit